MKKMITVFIAQAVLHHGWFKPYDNLQENFNKNSVTREFYDQTHL